jgi:hypothetical protein
MLDAKKVSPYSSHFFNLKAVQLLIIMMAEHPFQVQIVRHPLTKLP